MVEVKESHFKVITQLLFILDDIFDDCIASEGVPKMKMVQYKLGKTSLKKLFKQMGVIKK